MPTTQKDRDHAAQVLNSILEQGDQRELLTALREITAAFGGVPKVAEKARLNRTQLYRTLSDQGNPKIRSLIAILRTMGLRLAVQPIKKPASPPQRRSRQKS